MIKKLFPIGLALLGLVFVVAGGYTVYRGFDAKTLVKDELRAQNIVTPEDASIPNTRVDSPATAQSMADIIDHHASEASGGLTYSEMGRYMVAGGDPAGTNDEAKAVKDASGKPVANPVRNVAFQASALRTSLYTSVMAFNVSDLVVGLGLMIGFLGLAFIGIGVALEGLVWPAFARKVHVEPVTEPAIA